MRQKLVTVEHGQMLGSQLFCYDSRIIQHHSLNHHLLWYTRLGQKQSFDIGFNQLSEGVGPRGGNDNRKSDNRIIFRGEIRPKAGAIGRIKLRCRCVCSFKFRFEILMAIKLFNKVLEWGQAGWDLMPTRRRTDCGPQIIRPASSRFRQ